MTEYFCTVCNEPIEEKEIEDGDTRQFGSQMYHKECYKTLIDVEHRRLHKIISIRKLIKKPRFIVAWWTPYFWISIGMFFFIGNAISLNYFKNVAIYNLEELMFLGTTDPPFVWYLGVSVGVTMMMIIYGLYLLNHTEEDID